ncbi:hypothetical protein [Sphingomonas sp. 32-62-10]|nr:MAG: hypothetical protein B7Y98_11495 [Sphingomonas sp. 32-62-10]
MSYLDHPAAPRPRAERADGWTPDRQRSFLTAVAEGHTVEAACRLVGLTHQSAYAFRRRAAGATFALGWQAATLLARDKIADVLLARALDGQVETITRPNGETISRHRYDNRLASAMLARLDRLADGLSNDGTHHAARLVAQEFDAFLDLVDRDEGPARAGLFLGLRAAGEASDADLAPIIALARADRWCRTGTALAEEVPVADLDLADRAGWTADQWQRAEAAGLVALAASPDEHGRAGISMRGDPQLPQLYDLEDDEFEADDDDAFAEDPGFCGYEVRWCEHNARYRTDFPPPPDFDGDEDGSFGDENYERDLTEAEMAAYLVREKAEREEMMAEGRAAAQAYFFGGAGEGDGGVELIQSGPAFSSPIRHPREGGGPAALATVEQEAGFPPSRE